MSGIDLDRWSETRSLFDELVDLDPARRAQRLDGLGRSDPELRAAVDALLGFDGIAGERLKHMEFGIAQLLRGIGAQAHAASAIDGLGLAGCTIAHFHVLEPLGFGGMGVVYRARDERLQRIVALKFPLQHPGPDAAARERFLREARAAGGLDHPNLCSIYEAGESESGHLFLAMPLYAGRTLDVMLASSDAPLPLDTSLDIARQLADGLACAHAAGIIHRDLKPGNVMVLPDGTVKILDFGLAKMPDLSRTRSGAQLGTAAYMAPEQIRGEAVDARADLWSLGVVIYQMVAGRRPFNGDRDVSIAHAVLHEAPQPPSRLRANVPRAVEHLILDLLQKNPAWRYPDAQAVATDIAALLHGKEPALRYSARRRIVRWLRRRSPRAKKLGAGVLTAFLFVGAALAAGLMIQRTPRRPTRSAEAYEFFARAEQYVEVDDWTGENQRAAEALYRRAVDVDPEFALAWARLANVHSNEQFNPRTRSAAGLARFRQEAETALRIDPRLGEAHLVMGFYWRIREDYPQALAALSLARRYAPTNAEASINLGQVFAALGRSDDALASVRNGVRLDRRREGFLSDMYAQLRRFGDAARSIDRVLEISPHDYSRTLAKGFVYLYWTGTTDSMAAALTRIPQDWDTNGLASRARSTIARIRRQPAEGLAAMPAERGVFLNYFTPVSLIRARLLAQAGDSAQARAEYEIAASLLADSMPTRPDDGRLHLGRAEALAGLRRSDEAEAEIENALSHLPWPRAETGPEIMVGAAAVYTQLGEIDRALELLERVLQNPTGGRYVSVALLRVDPTWDALRGDPRFASLLRRFAE